MGKRWSRHAWAWAVLVVSGVALGGARHATAQPALAAESPPSAQTLTTAPLQAASQVGACAERVPVFEDGREAGSVCAQDARASGLTVVDLSDTWAPFVLSEPAQAEGALHQDYRASYVALANEDRSGLTASQPFERDLELFGILPSFGVLRARMLDDARHACHEAVQDAELAATTRVLSPYRPDLTTQRARVKRMRDDGRKLERGRERLGYATIDELSRERDYAYMVNRNRNDRAVVLAIEALQAHLQCDGYLGARYERGVFEARTLDALKQFERAHARMGSPALDAELRELILTDSRELTFRAVLRALRQRVVDATGVIEDGSAAGRFGQVLGRTIDGPEQHAVAKYGALPEAAEDLVSPLTEAAARALGWTDPQALAQFFRARDAQLTHALRVALRLPPPPPYHSAHMELRAELDRGDVWYAYPYREDGTPRKQPVDRRPTLTLLARDGERFRPLVRYATTIGGWQPEKAPSGEIGLRYKESPVGKRYWRDVVAAPVWLPPASTPDEELVQRNARGEHEPKLELIGPGFRSAYGLAMLVNLEPRWSVARALRTDPEGAQALFSDDACCVDEGVRAHGSVSYPSILRGYSHGCHRLFNELALRLTSFLLLHRKHVRHGQQLVAYDRTLLAHDESFELHLRSRGYRYELTPPVPIEVLEGRLRGPVRKPILGLRPLKEQLVPAVQAAAEGAADAPSMP